MGKANGWRRRSCGAQVSPRTAALPQPLDVLRDGGHLAIAQLFGDEPHHAVRIVRALARAELLQLVEGVLSVLPREPRKLCGDARAVRAVARGARRDAFVQYAAAVDALAELHQLGIGGGARLRL